MLPRAVPWLWLLLAALARPTAAEVADQSTAIDSLSAKAPADTVAANRPKAALWRSALVPGWGQVYNGRPVKAALFGSVAAGFIAATISEIDRLDRAQSAAEKQDRAARRNTRILLYVATATFAGLDAYVDAHLAGFKVEPLALQNGLGLSLSFAYPRW